MRAGPGVAIFQVWCRTLSRPEIPTGTTGTSSRAPIMGPLAEALAMDQMVRSPRALAIGWAPSLTSAARNVPRLLEERRDQVMGAG